MLTTSMTGDRFGSRAERLGASISRLRFTPMAELPRWTTRRVGVIPLRERFNSIFEIGGVGLVGKRGNGEGPIACQATPSASLRWR
jgi:hypothetical protein